MNKHTPGPWDYAPCMNFGHKSFQIHQKDGAPYTPYYSDVATTERGENAEVQEANARLIAAAPQMLEALEAVAPLLHWLDQEQNVTMAGDMLPKVLAAIAAAKGGGEV